MSLAARCPWCETVFRLTEGQVSAKGGMARCGVCSHTFNALDALLSDSAVAALERGAEARKVNQELNLKKSEPAEIPVPATAAALPTRSVPAPPAASPRDDLTRGGAIKTDPVVEATPAPAPAPISALRLPAFLMAKPRSPTSAPAVAPISPVAIESQAARAQPTPSAPSAAPSMPLFSRAATPSRASSATPTAVAFDGTPVGPDRKPALVAMPLTPPPAPPLLTPAPEPVSVSVPVSLPPAPSALVSQASRAAAVDSKGVESSEAKSNQAAPEAAPVSAPLLYQVELPNYVAAPIEQAVDVPARNASVFGPGHAEEVEKIRAALLVAREAAITRTGSADELRLQHEPEPQSRAERERDNERLGPSTFQPSFLKSEQGSPGWRRVRQALLFLACLAATLGLLGQAAYWWRSDLAMRAPELKPLLVRACDRLGCVVMPPAEIEQLSIESSELNAVPGATGTLGFTALIRNHSSNVMAFPAIEITLTDARDQAVLRRDFLPLSYLGVANSARQFAGIPPNSEYTIKLVFDTSGIATAGYRAGIFYP